MPLTTKQKRPAGAIAAMIASRTSTTSLHPSTGEITVEALVEEQRIFRSCAVGLVAMAWYAT
jgi:hypothetical protein